MKKIIKKRRGVTTIEYGILAALIAIVTIIAIKKIGNNNDKIYCTISSSIQKAQYAKGNIITQTITATIPLLCKN